MATVKAKAKLGAAVSRSRKGPPQKAEVKAKAGVVTQPAAQPQPPTDAPKKSRDTHSQIIRSGFRVTAPEGRRNDGAFSRRRPVIAMFMDEQEAQEFRPRAAKRRGIPESEIEIR